MKKNNLYNINLNKIKAVKKVFDEDFIPITFSSSDYFVPYLAITIESLLANGNKNINYDLIVFNKDISEQSKHMLEKVCSQDNVSIRFINVEKIFKKLNLYTPGHVTIETYFRLVIPIFMRDYDKILFLDSDLLIQDDIKKLYDIDITNYAVAAAVECLMSALLGIYGKDAVKYMYDKLHLKNADYYFQAGVMLMNIKYFNNNNCSKKLLNMVSNFNYNIVDQDALNELLNDKIMWLSNEWNYPPLQKHMIKANYIENMSEPVRNMYLSVKKPKILHFADFEKPWFYPTEAYADIWWQHARKSIFYEEIIKKMIEHTINPKIENSHASLVGAIYDIKHYKQNILKYWKYKFFKNFVWGKTKKRYGFKKRFYKDKIRNARQFIK